LVEEDAPDLLMNNYGRLASFFCFGPRIRLVMEHPSHLSRNYISPVEPYDFAAKMLIQK